MEQPEPIRLICDSGLEDVCADEAYNRLHELGVDSGSIEPGEPRSASVYLNVPPSALNSLHTVYHITHDLGKLTAEPDNMMEALSRWAAEASIPGLDSAESFRVTVERIGEHPFRSPDAERTIGGVLFKRTTAGVNLNNPGLNLRIDIRDNTARMGIQLNRKSLDKRYSWVYRPRVTLRTTIAAAMLQLGKGHIKPDTPDDPDRILDPCCGSGTILLEAARLYPESRIIGGDVDPDAVAGSLENALACGLAPRLHVHEWNALHLEESLHEGSIDLMVTNTPFGIRLGAQLNFRDFYQQLLQSAAYAVRPGGCLVLLIGRKRGLFNYILRDNPQWKQIDARVIDLGGSFPGLFALQRI